MLLYPLSLIIIKILFILNVDSLTNTKAYKLANYRYAYLLKKGVVLGGQ
jgi:hypothetical protein